MKVPQDDVVAIHRQLEELKARLYEIGFKMEDNRDEPSNKVRWRAYRTLPTQVECQCNDRPPVLIVHPFMFDGFLQRDGIIMRSVEFAITGELANGDWLNSKVYAVAVDKALAKLPDIERTLVAVWEAAYKESEK